MKMVHLVVVEDLVVEEVVAGEEDEAHLRAEGLWGKLMGHGLKEMY